MLTKCYLALTLYPVLFTLNNYPMEELIYQAVHWLSETYPGRMGRPTHRFEIVAISVFIIAAMISATLHRAKRKAFKQRTAQALEFNVLVATSLTDDNGQVVNELATLRQGVSGFVIAVSRDGVEVCQVSLRSLDEVEKYLRAHTSFVLSDFRRPAS